MFISLFKSHRYLHGDFAFIRRADQGRYHDMHRLQQRGLPRGRADVVTRLDNEMTAMQSSSALRRFGAISA